MSTKIYGIDLGTTYSCIAGVDEYGKPTVIKNYEGDSITPSVVQFDGESRVVGKIAKDGAQMYPSSTVSMVKLRMGMADWRFHYDGTDYSAEEISSFILRKVVGDAEAVIGEKITDVVITCPAYFATNEREATAKAGEIAGLNVRSIINEPTAAAIAYGIEHNLQNEQDTMVLVYDLGGGTFDITMIALRPGEIQVIATDGDHHLGGKNWDEVIVNYLADEWKNLTGSSEEPLDDPETLQDLWARAEQAKKSLSGKDKKDVAAMVMHRGQREKVTLTREKFDELTANLLEETIMYTRRVLEQARQKGCDRFDRMLLVGGSTRMPQVIERLRSEFGVEPQIVDPDEVVAKGAALFGQKLAIGEELKIILEGWGVASGEAASAELVRKAHQQVADDRGLTLRAVQTIGDLTIRNVTSVSFGVEALLGGKVIVSNLVRKNDEVPIEITQRFGTEVADQESVIIRIMENRSPELEVSPEDIKVEELRAEPMLLPRGLPQGSPIDVTFQLDNQGRLHVSAVDLTSNKRVDLDIETTHVIPKEEMEQAKQRASSIRVVG